MRSKDSSLIRDFLPSFLFHFKELMPLWGHLSFCNDLGTKGSVVTKIIAYFLFCERAVFRLQYRHGASILQG